MDPISGSGWNLKYLGASMTDKDLNARVLVLEETTRLQFKELFLRLKRIEMIMLASAAAIIGLLSSILAGQ